MTETEKRPPSKTKPAGGSPPLVPLLLLIIATGFGGFLRFPDSTKIDAEKVAITVEARESVAAAQNLLKGNGLRVQEAQELRPSRLAPGEPVTVAISHIVLGDHPASPLLLQFFFSTSAILLVGVAAWAGGGAWAAAAAAVFLALWPGQIESTRAVSVTPVLTFLLSASLATGALALRTAAPGMSGMLGAGLFAGLAATTHPLCILMGAGLLAGSLARLSWRACLGTIAGFALGTAPLWIHRIVVHGSPLISGERSAATPGMTGFQQFTGTPGTRLADWVGVDSASLSLHFNRGYFEHLVQSPGQAALMAIAAIALISILFAAARALFVMAIVAIGLLVAVPMLGGHGPGLPVSRGSESFLVLGAIGAGLAAVVLSKIRGVGGFLGVALALVPAGFQFPTLRDAIRSAPGILAPKPVEAAPLSGAGSLNNAPAPPETIDGAKTERAVASTNIGEETINKEKPVTPVVEKPVAPPPVIVEKPSRPANASDVAKVKGIVDGRGAMTIPTVSIEDDMVLLNLKLERTNMDSAMAHPTAASLSIKILREIQTLDRIRVRIQHADGRTLSTSTVLASKAKAYFEKIDDPFESRRLRDWWPLIKK